MKPDDLNWFVGYTESNKQLMEARRAIEALGNLIEGLSQVKLEFCKKDRLKFDTFIKVWTEDMEAQNAQIKP